LPYSIAAKTASFRQRKGGNAISSLDVWGERGGGGRLQGEGGVLRTWRDFVSNSYAQKGGKNWLGFCSRVRREGQNSPQLDGRRSGKNDGY